MTIRRLFPLLVLACLTAAGCATPQPVKDASAAQLQLIDSLDGATASLGQGLDQYAADKRDLIRSEARILVARMAIFSALADDQSKQNLVDFDTVFNLSNKSVRPYIDHTMEGADDLKPSMDKLKKRIDALPDTDENKPLRNVLRSDLKDLEELQALLANKPKDVLAIEGVVRDDLADLESTRTALQGEIGVLRAQVAVMKGIAATVNRWLTIDVTPSQGQVDSLTKTYSDLFKQLDAPKPATNPGSHP